MFKNKYNIIACLFICVLGLLVFTQNLASHGLEFRDDEVFYYKSSKEMWKAHNYLSPTYFGENRFQKPILFYWLILLSFKFFGVGWFAARFVSVFFGTLTLMILWLFAKESFNKRIATLSVLTLMTSPLFFRHAKNAVPDMAFNFFITLAIYCGYKHIESHFKKKELCVQNYEQENIPFNAFQSHHIFSSLFFISCSIGFMIKGFVAFIIPLLTIGVYAVFTKRMKAIIHVNYPLNFLISSMIILPWFIYMVKVHGLTYLDYMIVQETQARIFNAPMASSLFSWVKMYVAHVFFYLKVIFSYFAPWSLFFMVGIPFFIKKASCYQKEHQQPVKLVGIWCVVTVFFFSSLYFVINHYMLSLAFPFAVLVSCFLLYDFSSMSRWSKLVVVFRKYSMILFFCLGYSVFIFLFFFLAQGDKVWLPLFLAVFVLLLWLMLVKDNYIRVLILGGFMLFVLAQSQLLEEARLTSHSVLGKFAETIKKDNNNADFLIAVGSHDIHEKEFQVYFDQKVDKISVSWEWGMQESLTRYFDNNKNIYCLIAGTDYDKYLTDNSALGELIIAQEDYMFRRRLDLDHEFFLALIRFDQAKVYQYFMEKIILVKKE